MKKTSEHPEENNPVLNAVFIGLYIAALIGLLVMLFRRFIPTLHGAFDNFIAF